ncbi:MAG: CtsR family transcriptional regulator [Clostridia bacterium]|nr:CtsR family transcriptional regulator [Clostridia bacterium]
MLTDTIAKLIEEMLNEAGGSLELQRNDMAARLGCVPSQISYVITSRFTPERGYIIESRRGGGGCIRIVKKQMQRDEYLMHFFYAIGNEIDERSVEAYLANLESNGFIDHRERSIISAATSTSALAEVPTEVRNNIRAQIFRHIILSIMR